jgi:hypothetical protein
MDPTTAWFLIERVSNARISRLYRPDLESRRAAFHSFSGALSGLLYVDAIDREEHVIWVDKMLVALGFEPPQRREAEGNSFSIPIVYLGDGDPPGPRPSLNQPSVLIQTILGPTTEFEFHDGLVKLSEILIYSDKIVVKWQIIRSPTISAVFPDQMAALESDMEGLEDWAAVELTRKAERHLEGMALYQFSLSDDLGTDYEPGEHRRGNGSGPMAGSLTFRPAPPHTAWSLILSWHELNIEISLLHEGD